MCEHTLNKIECDFTKIECLVSPLSLSTRQYKINSLHGNLLWAVLLRQFAVCWGKGSSRYIYHPPATGYNSTHFEPLSRGADGGSGIKFHIIIEVQGSKRQMYRGLSRSSLRKRSKSTTWGDRDQRWAFAVMKNTVAFSESFIFPSGNLSLNSEFPIAIQIINSYCEGYSTVTAQSNMAKTINKKKHDLPSFHSVLLRGLFSKSKKSKQEQHHKMSVVGNWVELMYWSRQARYCYEQPPVSQSQSVTSHENQWRSVLHKFTQGPKLMEHDIVAILSLILEAEGMLKSQHLALKFWLRIRRIPSTYSPLARTSHVTCLTVMGQGNITLLCS